MLLALASALLLAAAPADEREPGVTLRVWHVDRELARIPELAPDQTPNADATFPTIDFDGTDAPRGFLGVASPIVTTTSGWIEIPADGTYLFRLTSDDGSRLVLDGKVAIDHDGRHGPVPKESGPIPLRRGSLPFRIDHFDAAGRRMLRLEWRTPETAFETLPAERLSTHRDLTRVTAPGPKRLADGLRPGDGLPVAGVHPSWTVSRIRPEGFEPMVGAMAFLPDGRLVVGTFFPLQRDERDLPDIETKEPDRLYALRNVTTGDRALVTVETIADGLYEPAGLAVVDGELLVSQRREITRLRDLDGDGFLETHETVARGWDAWNYHQFTRGLVHLDGRLYAALTTAMAPPAWEGMETNSTVNGPLRGTILEVDLASGELHAFAGGTRTPNGIGLGPRLDGPDRPPLLLYTDNQGTWMPTSQLSEVLPGRFYGHYNWTRLVPRLAERFPDGGFPSAYGDRARTPASLYLPHNEAINSPTDVVPIDDGPFAGQLFVAELTAGGVRRAFLERVNGQLQGALFRFTQGLESGVNAMVRGPDGALYLGGIGGNGNWNWRDTRFGLERLAPNGRETFELHSMSARPDGFEVRFTKPVAREWLADPANYRLDQWGYRPTAAYGGPKVALERLAVRAAEPSADGRAVRLRIDGLKTDRCVHLRTDPVSLDGEPIWSTEAWYTLQAIPAADPPAPATIGGVAIDPRRDGIGVGVGPPAGAVPLVSHGPPNALRPTRPDAPAPPMASQDDLIAANGELATDGLVTTTRFGDARLHVEWKAAPGDGAAASGIVVHERHEIAGGDGVDGWQAVDLWFRAARVVDGATVEPARWTVYRNGTLVVADAPLAEPDAAAGDLGPGGVRLGSLRLSGGDAERPVTYRNAWIAPLAETPATPGPWLDLLDPAVTGWVPRGGEAEIRVETIDGVPTVIGTARPGTPNTFLVSTGRFGDFELVYEARIDPRLNGGVQVRSEIVGGFDRRDGPVRGIQVELDPSPRAFSGGLYDERRRGWLHPLHGSPAARRAFRPGEWNRFRVVARGPVLETWVNGVPAASLFDATDADGHLGLQVHSIAAAALTDGEPVEVRYRDLRLRRLGATSPLSSDGP